MGAPFTPIENDSIDVRKILGGCQYKWKQNVVQHILIRFIISSIWRKLSSYASVNFLHTFFFRWDLPTFMFGVSGSSVLTRSTLLLLKVVESMGHGKSAHWTFKVLRTGSSQCEWRSLGSIAYHGQQSQIHGKLCLWKPTHQFCQQYRLCPAPVFHPFPSTSGRAVWT